MKNENIIPVPLGVCLEVVRHPHGTYREIFSEVSKVEWTEKINNKPVKCHMDRCIAWLKQHKDFDFGKLYHQLVRRHWYGC